MHDVASRSGVSIKTVSRVVNDEPAVRAATAERVLAAISELGFQRNDMARSLRSGRQTLSIGLVIGDLANPFYSAIARGVEASAWEHQSVVISGSSEEGPERERQLVAALASRRVDGLLIVPAAPDQRHLAREIAMGTPVVFMDRRPTNPRTDSIVLDNDGGVRQGVEHLLKAGHRRIALLADSQDIQTMKVRVNSFKKAMAAAGRPVDEDLVRVGLHDPAMARAATAEILAAKRRPTAFFTCNNRVTLGVVEELFHRGEDLEVVGFDDFELSHLVPIRLHVIAYDACELGRRAAEQLFQRISGSTAPLVHDVVETTLLKRGQDSLSAAG